MYVGEVHGAEFFFQVFGEYHLPRCGRGEVGKFVALSVEFDVLEEAVNDGSIHGVVW